MGEPSGTVDAVVDVVASDDLMSTLVALHTSADFFQLSAFNRARNKTSPGGKLARIFFKAAEKAHGRQNAASVTLDEMLRHQLEPLPAPLLRSCSDGLHSKALKAFYLVLRFSEDRCLTLEGALETGQKLLSLALHQPELKDELYMQLLKQLRGNADAASRLQLWQLFYLLAATVPPSRPYVTLLSHFVHEAAEDEEPQIKQKAVKTWRVLQRSLRAGSHRWLPTLQEIEAMLKEEKLKTVVYFLDETCEEISYDMATTVLEAVEQIAELIGLAHYHSFSLFRGQRSGDGVGDDFELLDDQSYVSDVLSDLGSDGQNVARLIFRKRLFRESDDRIAETQFLTLSYLQLQHDYLRGYYPVVYEDAARLCALQLFAEFGPDLPGEDRQLKRAIERFTPRDVKRSRSREEWKADVILRFTGLQSRSVDEARYGFVSLLRSLPYGQSSFFQVGRMDDPIGLLPPKLILGINCQGVHFFRPVPQEYLHSAEIRDIMQFGSSTKAVFLKMRVAGVLHVFQFETGHGEDICMAIQTHINDIMVRRYANFPPVAQEEQEKPIKTADVVQTQDWQTRLDAALQEQNRLIQEHGKHIMERDRLTGKLQDTLRHLHQARRERKELQEGLHSLQAEVQSLQGQVQAIRERAIRRFDAARAAELEKALEQEVSIRDRLQTLQSESRGIRADVEEMEEERRVRLKDLKAELFDAECEGQSRINLQISRVASLQKEIAQTNERMAEVQSERASLAEVRAELETLKGLAAEVEQRDAAHAVQIEHQTVALQKMERLYRTEQTARRKLYSKVQNQKGKIRVYARVRSILPSEDRRGQRSALRFPDDVSVAHSWKREDGLREYTFDGVFGPSASQSEVFQDTKELIQSAVDGYNICLFAYGQTGSGKTYTIYGTPDQPGLAPQGILHLFDLLNGKASQLRYHVHCTMLELYQDTLRDVLQPRGGASPGTKLEIKNERGQLVKVQGAARVEVTSAEECIKVLERGQAQRHVAETQLNIASSRSHLIMSLVVETTDLQTQIQTVGKLSFVDLAGSERNKKSGSTGAQLKEAQAINMSLSALGDVISALSRGDAHIPYRNHKLTMLMRDSLGGNAKTLMFVNVSPTERNLDETQNSLLYATRVRSIKNSAMRGVDRKGVEWRRQMAAWRDVTSDEVQNVLAPFL